MSSSRVDGPEGAAAGGDTYPDSTSSSRVSRRRHSTLDPYELSPLSEDEEFVSGGQGVLSGSESFDEVPSSRHHSTEKTHKCIDCEKRFPSPGKLRQHAYVHSGETPFECTKQGCDKKFTSRFKLKRHVLIHSQTKRFLCTVCDRAFRRKDHLKNHEKVHSTCKTVYSCGHEGCTRNYNSFTSYRKHQAMHAAEDGALDCKICHKELVNQEELMVHLKVHYGSRSVKCSEDKKFPCEQCDKRFFTRKDLKRHSVVHTGDREFACPYCNHRFGRKDHMTRHAKKTHPNEYGNDPPGSSSQQPPPLQPQPPQQQQPIVAVNNVVIKQKPILVKELKTGDAPPVGGKVLVTSPDGPMVKSEMIVAPNEFLQGITSFPTLQRSFEIFTRLPAEASEAEPSERPQRKPTPPPSPTGGSFFLGDLQDSSLAASTKELDSFISDLVTSTSPDFLLSSVKTPNGSSSSGCSERRSDPADIFIKQEPESTVAATADLFPDESFGVEVKQEARKGESPAPPPPDDAFDMPTAQTFTRLRPLSGDSVTQTKNPVLPSVYTDNALIVPEPSKTKYPPQPTFQLEEDSLSDFRNILPDQDFSQGVFQPWA